MKKTLSGKYLAVLALTAAGILFIGGRFRPRKAEQAAPSPTETARLQQSVRRDQATGIGQYLAGRAAELADQAVFLASHGTSGVRYETPAKVLTVDGSGELMEPVLMVAETISNLSPAPVATVEQNRDNWVLIVGRSAQDRLLWTAAIQGTSHPSLCNGVTYQELVLNVTLDKSFAGAGAFDLNGRLLGIVMPCGEALHIVSIASVSELLAISSGPDRAFAEQFGFRAAPLPEGWRSMYPRLKGLIITDVWIGRWADRNGLLPGDLIVTEEQALQATNMGTELRIARPGRAALVRLRLDLPGNRTGIAVVPAASPLPELFIAHGTPAERAGLRSGDHLISVLGRRNTSVSILSKLLAEPGRDPVRIVYQRGGKRSVVEVPNE